MGISRVIVFIQNVQITLVFLVYLFFSECSEYVGISSIILIFFSECSDYVGISSGIVRGELMTASSSRDRLTLPSRARLGLNSTSRNNFFLFILSCLSHEFLIWCLCMYSVVSVQSVSIM